MFNAVQQPGKRRKKRGVGQYVVQAMKQLPFAQTPHAKLIVDNQRYEIPHLSQLWVNNTRRLARVVFRPEARCDDGLLDVTAFYRKSSKAKPNIIFLAGGLIHDVLRPSNAAERIRVRGKNIELSLESPLDTQIDGEPLGKGDTIGISVIPTALRVLVPRSQERVVFGKKGILLD
jgi:diacylglycerol kinase (ATP)